MTDSDLTSEVSLSSQLSSRASDGLSFMCTSEINYSSDQTSGNEEG
jgi:F-box/leucine-rich repeat protein 2/20